MTTSQPNPDQLHASALVIDTHADTPQRFVDESRTLTSPLGHGHLNLESARRGNLAAEFFAIWPEPRRLEGKAFLPNALTRLAGGRPSSRFAVIRTTLRSALRPPRFSLPALLENSRC